METVSVELRKGVRSDCESVAALIKELAEYEKHPEEAKLSPQDLERDGYDSEPPLFYLIVAELNDKCSEDNGKVIGYGLYHYAYNMWSGQDIHLEDFYVQPRYRHKGVGEKIISQVAKIVIGENLPRISFECLDWNEPAKRFYKKHGAKNVTLENHWLNFRFTNVVMNQLANE